MFKTKFLDWEEGEFEVDRDRFSRLRLTTKLSEYWLVETSEVKPCMVCKKPASLLDLYSEGYICSKRCEEKWSDYLTYVESLSDDDDDD